MLAGFSFFSDFQEEEELEVPQKDLRNLLGLKKLNRKHRGDQVTKGRNFDFSLLVFVFIAS